MPSRGEQHPLRVLVSRRGVLGLSAVGMVTLGAGAGPRVPGASAVEDPSWEDVPAAKATEAVKTGEVQRIQGLIDGLTSEVTRTRGLAEHTGEVFHQAQQEFFGAALRADRLQSHADAEAARAVKAANTAGQVAAQLYRDGGNPSMSLFPSRSAAEADDLLARLGTADKLIERNQAVYAAAVTARDSAKNLTTQAVAAPGRARPAAEDRGAEDGRCAACCRCRPGRPGRANPVPGPATRATSGIARHHRADGR